jgi:glycosyltransferase involved in cell wall biosynthesis
MSPTFAKVMNVMYLASCFCLLLAIYLKPVSNDNKKSEISICLCVMLRNEKKNVLTLLNSIHKIVDCVSVLDTGSTDGTQEIIRNWSSMTNIPVHIHEGRFVDFGISRTHSFQIAKEVFPNSTYMLILDARHRVSVDNHFEKQALIHDFYYVDQTFGSFKYTNVRLLKTELLWKCYGIVHEYWQATNGTHSDHLQTMQINDNGNVGNRSKKLHQYGSLLRNGIASLDRLEAKGKLDDDSYFLRLRYYFYLANTYVSYYWKY